MTLAKKVKNSVVATTATASLVATMLGALTIPAFAAVNTTDACPNPADGVPIIIKTVGAGGTEVAGCYQKGAFDQTGDEPTIKVKDNALNPADLYFKKAYVDVEGTQVPMSGLSRQEAKAYVDFAGQNDQVKTLFDPAKTNSPVVFEYIKRESMLQIEVKTDPTVAPEVISAPKYTDVGNGLAKFSVTVKTNREYAVDALSDNPKIKKVEHTWTTDDNWAYITFGFEGTGLTKDDRKVTISFKGTKKTSLKVTFDPKWVESTKMVAYSVGHLKSWEVMRKSMGDGVTYNYVTPNQDNKHFRKDGSTESIYKAGLRVGYHYND